MPPGIPAGEPRLGGNMRLPLSPGPASEAVARCYKARQAPAEWFPEAACRARAPAAYPDTPAQFRPGNAARLATSAPDSRSCGTLLLQALALASSSERS